jgi:thioredoxin reductase
MPPLIALHVCDAINHDSSHRGNLRSEQPRAHGGKNGQQPVNRVLNLPHWQVLLPNSTSLRAMTDMSWQDDKQTALGTDGRADVIVVGGGLAGLAGALTLVRARRSVLVIDAGNPRNAPAAHAHGYLTRDGASPLELPAAGRAEVAGYGGQIRLGTVTSLARLPGGDLRATLADGTNQQGRRVLVATGLVDEFPDIPGLRERWGRDVVHCPFCFGWELRDQPLAVVATGPQAATQALMWRQWSTDVALFLHNTPTPDGDLREQLAARGIGLVEGEVIGVEVAGDRLSGVRLRSGQVISRRAVVIGPRFEARHALLDGLGIAIVEHPLGIGHQVAADATGRTSAAGIWVAGNAVDVAAGVLQAAASGVTAAAVINADLTAEDTAAAVAARRAATALHADGVRPTRGSGRQPPSS